MLLDMGGAPTSTPTVAEIIDAHMSDATYAPRTRAEVERAIRKLPDVFMQRKVAEVTPSVMAGLWREMTAAGRSPHELKRVRDVLSKSWKRAITLEWASSNPVLLVPPPSPGQADEIVPPTRAQVRAIIAAADDRPLALFLRLAAITGARRGELCGLQWDDLRLEVPEVIIRRTVAEHAGGLVYGEGKTGRAGHRVMNLDAPTVKALRKHPRIVGSRWVFTFDGDTPWRPSYVSREFHRICTALGHRHRLNDLRHHAATEWLAAGTPVPTVAQMLGHATASTTLKVYAHFIPAQARDTIIAHAAALDAG